MNNRFFVFFLCYELFKITVGFENLSVKWQSTLDNLIIKNKQSRSILETIQKAES